MKGDFLYSKWANIEDTNNAEDTTNVEAETVAIYQETKNCSHSQHNKAIIKNNFLTLQKILIRELECPLSISDIIEQVWILFEYKQVQFQHIHSEGNQLADHHANLAIDKGEFTFTSFQQL